MASGAVIAIQDMGAAGLTSSAVEMGAKGDLGIELDLDKVPCREEGMTAYEMMLSESQERMLMVLDPAKETEAQAIFHKWDLDFAIVGKTTDTLRFVIKHQGEVMADLPIKQMGDEAPEYDRPWVEPKTPPVLTNVPAPNDLKAAILKIVGSPDMCSRRWVFEQYDSLIGSNTAQIPGGDAGVVRIRDKKAIAVSTDVTPRYVEADPFEGGKQAVAECWRNLTAVGADPIAITDNLNFGNPERPEIMGQFVKAIQGLSAACSALSFPIVSGNVSLYNETNGQAILPTPAIGGIGLIPDLDRMATIPFKAAGEAILLIGGHGSHLGQSIYLREVLGREDGAPPPVDLAVEKRNGDFVRSLIKSGQVTAVHDISDGGLVLAVIEMAMPSGHGAHLVAMSHERLFGEDQARYVITAPAPAAQAILAAAAAASVPAERVGVVTAEAALKIEGQPSISVAELRSAHEGWFPAFMAGEL
jgi:phosphoribosylformylglycinamidine synthase